MTDSKAAAALEKVFAILDPTRMVQPALDKAEWVAERNQASLTLYCCVYDTELAFQRESQDAAVGLARAWIERLAERAAHFRLDDPRDDVGRAAGGEHDDDPHRLRRVCLPPRRPAGRHHQSSECAQQP